MREEYKKENIVIVSFLLIYFLPEQVPPQEHEAALEPFPVQRPLFLFFPLQEHETADVSFFCFAIFFVADLGCLITAAKGAATATVPNVFPAFLINSRLVSVTFLDIGFSFLIIHKWLHNIIT
jgi:hypothetical protein